VSLPVIASSCARVRCRAPSRLASGSAGCHGGSNSFRNELAFKNNLTSLATPLAAALVLQREWLSRWRRWTHDRTLVAGQRENHYVCRSFASAAFEQPQKSVLQEEMIHALESVCDLSNDALLAEVKRLAGVERGATAALLRALIELDVRRLYLGEGYSSLFTYCTQVLHLAEGAAYNRIEAARAARRFPLVLNGLEDGSLTLTAVRLLAPHLTAMNHAEVLASAQYLGKREIERLAASLAPKPPVPPAIRKLPQPRLEVSPNPQPSWPSPARDSPGARPVVAPLAPELYKIQLTISRDTHDKLRRVQDLLRHAVPSGDPAAILDRALTVLLEKLERTRCATVPSPRPARAPSPGSRHIPASVRRDVWRRDGGRCAFTGTSGRCRERAFLEFHHVEPHAAGGGATVDNIELRCRAHNQYEALLFFEEAHESDV